MNLEALQSNLPHVENIQVLGKTISVLEHFYHVVGVFQEENQNVLAVLGIRTGVPVAHKLPQTPRQNRKQQDTEGGFFPSCSQVVFGDRSYSATCSSGEWLKNSPRAEALLFEFFRAGWRVPGGDPFLSLDLEELTLTQIYLERGAFSLPDERKGPLSFVFSQNDFSHLLEIPVTLRVCEDCDIAVPFTLEDGRPCICYIQRVSLMDPWKDAEEEYQDLVQQLGQERARQQWLQWEEAMENTCPRGMRLLQVEYETTLPDVYLTFLSKEYLDRPIVPIKGRSGTFSVIGYLSVCFSSDPPGKHGGMRRRDTPPIPMSPDTTEVEAELFEYHQQFPKWTLTVPL